MIVITQIEQELELTVDPTTEVINIEVNEIVSPTVIVVEISENVIINIGGTTITPYATFDFVKKGFGNPGIIPGAEGDVYQGWVSDGVYCPYAIYDGSGALDNPASFEIITTIEI